MSDQPRIPPTENPPREPEQVAKPEPPRAMTPREWEESLRNRRPPRQRFALM